MPKHMGLKKSKFWINKVADKVYVFVYRKLYLCGN